MKVNMFLLLILQAFLMTKRVLEKVLVIFFDYGESKKAAERMASFLKQKGFSTSLREIVLTKKLSPRDQARNEKELKFKTSVSCSGFNYVIVGSPIFSFSPTPAVNSFLRKITAVKGKKFVLFTTSVGLPGNAVKKMQSILATKGVEVIASQNFSSIFEFDEKKFLEIDAFVESFLPLLK